MADAASVRDFNRRLKLLMVELARLRPNDASIARTQKRLVLASDQCPELVLDWTGQTLFRYNESIYSDDPKVWEKFFTPGDTSLFEDSLGRSKNSADRSDAEKIIYEVQTLVSKFDQAKKVEYIETVRILLDYYLEWASAKEQAGK
jgi:hypothetical protein